MQPYQQQAQHACSSLQAGWLPAILGDQQAKVRRAQPHQVDIASSCRSCGRPRLLQRLLQVHLDQQQASLHVRTAAEDV